MMKKLQCVLLFVLLLMAPGWAKKNKSQASFNGQVTVVQPATSTFNIQDRNGTVVVLTQQSTEFRNKFGQRSLVGIPPGSSVKVEGIRLDDGRILATKVEVKALGQAVPPLAPVSVPAQFQLTNLRSGTRVPASFNVQGVTLPNSRVVVLLRSNTSGANYNYEGQSNYNGNFDISARANNEPFGGKMQIRVEAFGPNGASIGQKQLQLIRQ